MLAEGAPELSLPECENADDILQAFYLSGMAMSGGMGATALTWQELQALNAHVGLNSWELKQVHAMSKAYCAMLHKAEKRIPPPYMRELEADEVAWIAKQQAEAFDRLERQTSGIKTMKKSPVN